jgi:thiol-disulfide isomerase/thioredoxin
MLKMIRGLAMMNVPAVAMFLFALLLAGCSQTKRGGEGEHLSSIGMAGAGFSIPDLANPGRQLSLATYKDQVVLLDFWATWCPPCKTELPALNRLYDELKAKGFVVVGMTVDNGSEAQVAEAVSRFKLSYPVGLAGEDVQRAYGGIRAVPTKFLLDKKGTVAKQYLGVVPERQLRADIEALLAL